MNARGRGWFALLAGGGLAGGILDLLGVPFSFERVQIVTAAAAICWLCFARAALPGGSDHDA